MTRAAETGRQAADQTAHFTDRGLRQAADMARQQSEQARNLMASSADAYRDLTQYSRADFDAMFQSGARLAQGFQEMSMQMTNFTQESFRIGMRLANELLGCRTVEDVVAAQREFVRESVDILMAGSARFLSMSSKVASDAVTPIKDVAGNGGFAELAGEGERGADIARGAPSRPREPGGREYRH